MTDETIERLRAEVAELRAQLRIWYDADGKAVELESAEEVVRRRKEAAVQLADYDHLFEMQQRAMAEATALWRQATGKHEILPGLHTLLDWLMRRGGDREASREG